MFLFTTVVLTSCSTQHTVISSGGKNAVTGESVVLNGEEPAKLAFPPVRRGSIDIRSTYLKDLPQTIHFTEGRDFTIDYKAGLVRRTSNSRLPDFRTNMLFGVEDFDHSKFPGFGNSKFFAYVDYVSKQVIHGPTQASQIHLLPRTLEKLQHGDHLKIVAFGDSITAGGDASTTNLIFWQRWAEYLQQKYPRANVEAINGATGGDTTRQGLDRLQEKVLNQKPDVVLIGFGMNDHNIGGFGTPLDQFAANLTTIIDRIRANTSAEVVLYSTFPPNPKWHYGSHQMQVYAAATERVAREKGCAFADVYNNWVSIAAKKKPEDMLANNINHPNDYGHGLYFEVLKRLGL